MINMLSKEEEFIAMIILIFVFSMIGLAYIQMATVIHEFMGHNFILRLFGCKPVSGAGILAGATQWEDCELSEGQHIIAALTSPILCFMIGYYLWNIPGGEDAFTRLMAIPFFVYSSIVSLFPALPGSDMAYAISHGFSPTIGWIIFLLCNGLWFWLLLEEISEKRIIVSKYFK